MVGWGKCKITRERTALAGARCQPIGTIIISFLLTACKPSSSALDPKGPAAAEISTVAWIMFSIAGAVFIVMVTVLLHGLFRHRRAQPQENQRAISNTTLIIFGGVALSALILMSMMALDIRTNRDLAFPPKPAAFAVEVVGRQWWWEVNYPTAQVTTANEIHIPTDQAVETRVASADVIHSFWVPQLQGKTDMIPGRVNIKWLQADKPGIYRGQCAEYCGVQHAHMAFHVVAESPDDFRNWLEDQSKPAVQPTDPVAQQGMELFLRAVCVTCHTIRGTNAQGKVGPDLTHVGSRSWIAAGTLQNTQENRAKWIANTQKIKPGNLMPDFGLYPEGDFAQAVATYLGTLR